MMTVNLLLAIAVAGAAADVPDINTPKQMQVDYGTDLSHIIGELLEHFHVNRFNCPYVFAIIVMNPEGE